MFRHYVNYLYFLVLSFESKGEQPFTSPNKLRLNIIHINCNYLLYC